MNLETARTRAQERANQTGKPVEIRVRHYKAVREGRQTKTPGEGRRLRGNYNRDPELVATKRAEPIYVLTKVGENSSATLVETVQPAGTAAA